MHIGICVHARVQFISYNIALIDFKPSKIIAFKPKYLLFFQVVRRITILALLIEPRSHLLMNWRRLLVSVNVLLFINEIVYNIMF